MDGYIETVGKWLSNKGFQRLPPDRGAVDVLPGGCSYRLEGNSLVLVKLIDASVTPVADLLNNLAGEFRNLESLRGGDSPLSHPDGGREMEKSPEPYSPQDTQVIEIPSQPGRPWITYSIIALCGVLALLTGFSTDLSVMTRFGAKVNDLIAAGEFWRLMTSVFLHFGPLHLAFNMLFLYNLGPGLELLFGHWRYLIIYLAAGLAGSVASFAFTPGISVGASGALFGLIGSFLYFWLRKPKLGRRIGKEMVSLLLFNVIFGLLNPSVDNWAHFGGLIGGFLASAAVGFHKDEIRLSKNVAAVFALGLLVWAGLTYGIQVESSQARTSFAVQRRLVEARILIQQKAYRAVPDQLNPALLRNPDNPEVHRWLGYSYAKLGKRTEALAHLNEALRLKPKDQMLLQLLEAVKKDQPLPD